MSMGIRNALKKTISRVSKHLGPIIISSWAPYSRLAIMGDGSNWVLSQETRELRKIAGQLGIRQFSHRLSDGIRSQCFFFLGQLVLEEEEWFAKENRVGVAYFHGLPGTGYPEFDRLYRHLCLKHTKVHRVQVSHSQMRDTVLSSGISPEKVFLIPIGINLSYFHRQSRESREKARREYGIPQSAVVIGSFQKDGTGWGEGMEPKLVKGPDVFIRTLGILRGRIHELFVVLTGPARGYVKAGLRSLGLPFKHFYFKDYRETGRLFQTLDLYMVTSRQEGGPKAVLESMASGVPLVTTKVGQAMDIVIHGVNGWMVEPEDAEGLAHFGEKIMTHREDLGPILENARKTAEENSYTSQIPLWHDFMEGFVRVDAF
jgi:glycosyltransferase involved in cell wall biosynthesis